VRISPDRRQILATVGTFEQRLQAGLLRRAATAREWLERLAGSQMLVDPSWILRDRRSMLDAHDARLKRLIAGGIERARERLTAAAGRLDAVSPLAILARGYSVTWLEEDGVRAARPLVAVQGLAAGTRLVTQLATGRIHSRVEGIDLAEGTPEETVPGNVRGDRKQGGRDDGP
jgi:exodeoxyribonuclease VII large subunit